MGYGKTNETNLTKEKNMGFDLYSLGNHKTEKGEYFRNSVWGWRRLADFVCEQTGVIAEDNKKYWQSNDGHEVSEQEAMQIAQQLKALIKDGTVSKAIQEVEEEEQKAKENNKFVDRCHDMIREKVERETGKTNLAPADYPSPRPRLKTIVKLNSCLARSPVQNGPVVLDKVKNSYDV